MKWDWPHATAVNLEMKVGARAAAVLPIAAILGPENRLADLDRHPAVVAVESLLHQSWTDLNEIAVGNCSRCCAIPP